MLAPRDVIRYTRSACSPLPCSVDIAPPVREQGTPPPLRDRLAGLLPELRAFARYLCGNRSEADDLVQEALLRTLRSLETREAEFLSGQIDLRAWALAVIRNAFHEQLRRRRREVALPETPAEEVATPPLQEEPGRLRDLSRALAELPPLLREAVILVGAQGLPYAEAAAICGVPVGTMKARVTRGRRLLAVALGAVTG
ncbi:sigma-70 family RNA polymerase sigma factor [Siccirubricoccus sp. KC 17139]|uniref:Sigma-70 family RNA polymerase sigma factor n=1 Tax=Siccirubricoccus soli TaxID=2899147 RepID=A0ABT1D5F8_9PROT|nr:sigma-70 family RNA polymerase sigma factor [Siccirubricoccus soli]MCO6417155.1 sigma-70 family RNA polymerase sigma factor [Siccirubricoccus soli]MCP2683290.1 sigma-70 family RNA polymerase sigma factor [Siccirubricoccus soli]